MRPLDPRLLRQAARRPRYVVLTAGLGVATAGARRRPGPAAGPGDRRCRDGRRDLRRRPGPARRCWSLVVLRAGAAVAWAQERFGHRAATTVIAQLRGLVVGQRGDRPRPEGRAKADAGPAPSPPSPPAASTPSTATSSATCRSCCSRPP